MSEPVLRISPKKYSGETTIVSMRMSKELLKDIDNIAKVTGRNRNEIMAMSLEFALNHIEIVMKEREENKMAVIKCKMCGGDLVLVEGQSVAECEYCGSRQKVPVADNEKKLTLFARANRLRAACEFDKAAGIY